MAESGEVESATDAEGTGESDEEGTFLTRRAKAGLLIAALGVAVPGLTNNLLTQAGFPGVGALVWAVGFGTTVVALWYVLLRPLDLGAETEA
jgi:hypothetical protein